VVGKSTTLNILTTSDFPTFGDIYYNGKNIKTMKFLNIGYCNQKDKLWNELIIKEHLIFFQLLRGFPKDIIDENVLHYIYYYDLQ